MWAVGAGNELASPLAPVRTRQSCEKGALGLSSSFRGANTRNANFCSSYRPITQFSILLEARDVFVWFGQWFASKKATCVRSHFVIIVALCNNLKNTLGNKIDIALCKSPSFALCNKLCRAVAHCNNALRRLLQSVTVQAWSPTEIIPLTRCGDKGFACERGPCISSRVIRPKMAGGFARTVKTVSITTVIQ